MSTTQTFLGMVNEVLKELRETPVTTINQTSYSTLIARWINGAKRQVEDAWDWQPLGLTVNLNLVISQLDYDLTALTPILNARARLQRNPFNFSRPMAFDVTTGNPYNLIDQPVHWINQMRDKLPTPQTNTVPIYFGLERYNNGSNDGIRMRMWETPTAVRNWRIYFTNPQDDLVNEVDPIYVPWYPVVMIATDIALSERGEEIGEPGTTIDQRRNLHITNAIGVDATFQDYKQDFYPA